MPPRLGVAAGSAVARRQNAAVDITANAQERLRYVINELAVASSGTAVAAPPARVLTAPLLQKEASQTYEELLKQGFERKYIEQALNALPPQCLSTEAALDWLLFELSKDQLPKQYAEEIQTTGGVELKQYARKERELKQTPESQLSEAEEAEERAAAAQAAAAAKAAAEKAAARQAQERAEAEEKEKAARRAWILQYAAESEDEDDSGSEASAASETSSIEDWEVWGDAREIERRKAERKRTSLPREKRLALISEELAGAKARAAKAKASGDKGGQRAVGQIIGQLKREMAELGITEEDLPSVMEEGIGGEEAGAAPSNGVFGEEPDAFGEPAESPHAEEATAENGGKGGADGNSDAEDMPPSFDLFGDGGDAAALESVPGSAKRKAAAARAAAAAALKPWGDSSGGKGGGKAKGGGKGAPKPPEAQQPKALLQQACQRRGWGAPRYEKLTPGGDREPSGTGLRYSVVIDLGKAPGPKRKGARGAHAGPQKFVLPEGLDGWQRIEEAQNAAAVLALLCLCGNEDSEMWQRLAPPFDELWLECLDGGVGAVVEETEEEGAARDAFIAALVETKLAEASQQARRSKSAGAEAERFNGASWEANLAESLHKHKEAKDGAASRATSERLLHLLREFRDSKEGADWQAVRAKLPAAALRSQLQEALDQHDVVIVSGETGSGKTTQVPQFILEGATEAMAGGATNIVCTQPRRIAAISVAERVACERGEPAPGERGSVVGYSVRLDSATTADTRLLFCTTGVLLRRLIGDPALATVSHVIVDEVHERTMQGDFLVALLRELVAQRREAHAPLKVILMSATLDAGLLADYFGGCPVLHALGRTFPVQQFYLEDVYEATGYVLAADAPVALRPGGCYRRQQRRLENAVGARNRAAVRSGWGDGEADGPPLNPHYDADLYEEFSAGTRRNLGRVDEDRIDFDLIEELVSMVHETQGEGAILIFLPGMGEIANLQRRLEAIRELRGHWIIPLHSAVAPADQRKAFKRPPKGLRKIVLATNIAETSVTVEDVRFVIDTGRLKERRHDASRSMSLLVEDWASVAAVKQRKGRAGRTQEGICYALYTRHRFEHQMKKFQTPEMLRVPLDELVLQVHLLRLANSAEEFTAKVLQPPSAKAVEGAVRVLQEVGALTPDESLTPLGYHLAQLPVDARVGKLLIFGAFLGCLSPVLSIAACLSHKPPFSGGSLQDGADAARAALAAPGSGTLASGQQSDHLVMAAAVDGWLAALKKDGKKGAGTFARKHFLSEQTLDMLRDMRAQFATMLADIGFARGSRSGRNVGDGQATGQRHWYDDRSEPFNKHASHPAVVKAVLLAALFPNLAVMDDSSTAAGQRPGWHDGFGAVAIHPSSICAHMPGAAFQRPFLTYLEKMRTSQVFLRDCTVVSPAAVLLFGSELQVDHAAGKATVGGWVQLRVPGTTAALVRRLRVAMQELLAGKVAALRRRQGEEGEGGGEVVEAIVQLLNHEEAAQGWGK